MKKELVYLPKNNIYIEVSEKDSNQAVVFLNGENIFESHFIHYLKDRIENKMYRYKSTNEHEDFIKGIKREILNQGKTFNVIYSQQILSLLYPEKPKEEEIDFASLGMIM
jgi:hypothetical protein